jgi:diguanylate cyclase (GGDEF)-like protein
MVRLLVGLGLVAPVSLLLLALLMPHAVISWFDEGFQSVIAAVVASTLGVSLTAVVVSLYMRLRLGSLVRAAEQIARGDVHVEVRKGSGGLDGRLATAIAGISESFVEAHSAATVDRLTGVANRQALLGALFNEVERAARYNRPLSVAFVDIDHFKAVNDTYGHAVGDVVLRGVAQTIRTNLRATDLIGRYGGEEFMLLLTETNPDEGALLTEKLRNLVLRQRFPVDGNPNLAVTISIGVAGGVGAKLRVDTLVRDADAAMYSAKALGRNQTYVFEEPDEDSRVPRAPISAAGRARANEIGRVAREAATAALASVVVPLPSHRGQPSAIISSIVMALARQLDLPEAEIERLRMAAILHDIGKVAVPEEILDKPATLTSTEWRTVVQHPRIGQVILEQAAALKDAVPIILHHHERYSGHGYPLGLRGTDIPLGARIVAIADAYDAMTNERPHRSAMSHEAAVTELRRQAGTQFDPELVGLFCELFAEVPPRPDRRVAEMIGPVEEPKPRRRRRSGGAGGAGSGMAAI